MKKPISKITKIITSVIVLGADLSIMGRDSSLEKLLGKKLTPGQALDFKEIVNPCDLEKISKNFSEVILNGRACEEIRASFVQHPGSYMPALVSMQPLVGKNKEVTGVVVTIKAPAPRAREEKEVVKIPPRPFGEETKNESLFEALPEGAFTINTEWKICSFNRMAEEITGFSREKVIGRLCRDIFRSDLCNEGCPLRSALQSGHACIDQDVRIINKKGGKQTIMVNAGVLRDKNGEVAGAVETFRPLTGVFCIRRGSLDEYVFDNIIGKSESMKSIFSILPDVAASDANVLICGESGTGKDLLAKTIHNHSPRRNAPFVAVNCAALAETLLESELFGHEKAAFTGADSTKKGRFELVRGGALFLDEIGELKPALQIKLLRVLEQREFERVGGSRTIAMDARIISATNRDLDEALKEGKFREDFYFRLRTIPITLPPLRERKEDIPLLVDFFIRRLNFHTHKCVRAVSPGVMRFFVDYHWPGNVRELQRSLEHAFVFVKGAVIQFHHLPNEAEFGRSHLPPETARPEKKPSYNRETIQWALEQARGGRSKAAKLLGISRTSLWRRMKEFDLL